MHNKAPGVVHGQARPELRPCSQQRQQIAIVLTAEAVLQALRHQSAVSVWICQMRFDNRSQSLHCGLTFSALTLVVSSFFTKCRKLRATSPSRPPVPVDGVMLDKCCRSRITACMQDAGCHAAHRATVAVDWGSDWHLLLRLMKRRHRRRESCDARAFTLHACHRSGCPRTQGLVKQTPPRAG